MLLSKLVYLCVKNALYLNDTSFNYKDFVNGSFDNDIDYATNINNVFSPLNEAIARLSDLNRIPFIVEKARILGKSVSLSKLYFDVNKEIVEVYQNISKKYSKDFKVIRETMYVYTTLQSGYPVYIKYSDGSEDIVNVNDFLINNSSGCDIDLTQFSAIVKEVIGVAQNNNALTFKQKFIDTISIFSPISNLEPIYVEYKEDIKPFDREDIVPIGEDDIDNNIDLRIRYGISESACAYIIEYVQGKLLEPIAPELSNLHISRSESYFSNLHPAKSFTSQSSTRKIYSIGE